MEKAKIKCLINNSITTSVKTLIQKEILDNRMQQIANIQNEVNKMIETDVVGE